MTTIRSVYDTLSENQKAYESLTHKLAAERSQAEAEAASLKATLKPMVDAAVARALPSIDAPAVSLLANIASDLRIKDNPFTTRTRLLDARKTAEINLKKIAATYGTDEQISTKIDSLSDQMARFEQQQRAEKKSIQKQEFILNPLTDLNRKLEERDLPAVDTKFLSKFDRPSSLAGRALRWAMDPAYRLARPVLDQLQKDGVDIAATQAAIATSTKTQREIEVTRQTIFPELQNYQQAKKTASTQREHLLSEREILNAMRISASRLMAHEGAFQAVTSAMPSLLPPEAKGLHVRACLMDKLASRLDSTTREARNTASDLDDPVKNLGKAVRSGKGSRPAKDKRGRTIDVSQSAKKMQKHQAILGQRLRASEDIRRANRSSYSRTESCDNDDWLLWYLIMSNNNNTALATSAAFSAGQGHSGGGGASGQWDDAPNSYFRADMLGVTPQTAPQFGIDAKALKIEPDVLHSLGVTVPDMSDLSAPSASFNGLNDMKLDIDSPKAMDLGQLDLGEMTKQLDIGNIGGGITVGNVSVADTDLGGGSGDSCSFSGD